MQVLNTGPVQALRAAQKNKGRHKGAVLGLVFTASGWNSGCSRSLAVNAGSDWRRRKRACIKPLFAALHFALLRYALGGT
jgi:hypothetical protein